jgi:hypothetical protein
MYGKGFAKIAYFWYNFCMTESDNSGSFGKKIFFLYPSAFVQNQVIAELAQDEFEVYVLKDEAKLRQAVEIYPNSIVFASINETMREEAWDKFVRTIMGDPKNDSVKVGVIASVNNEEIKKRYLEQYRVQCGFTVIRSDFTEAVKELINILNGVDAKGRRKFIRIIMEGDSKTTVNLPMNGTFVNGIIKDISVVGFSCVFEEDQKKKKNGLFGDIQIRLQSQLINAEGIVFGSRMDGDEKCYVILFSKHTDPSVRTKIRKYIQSSLQHNMEKELK